MYQYPKPDNLVKLLENAAVEFRGHPSSGDTVLNYFFQRELFKKFLR